MSESIHEGCGHLWSSHKSGGCFALRTREEQNIEPGSYCKCLCAPPEPASSVRVTESPLTKENEELRAKVQALETELSIALIDAEAGEVLSRFWRQRFGECRRR